MMIVNGRRGTIDSEKTFVGICTDLMKTMNLLWVDSDFREYYLVINIITIIKSKLLYQLLPSDLLITQMEVT